METIRNFIRQEKGGLALLFAIILPFVISCCALAFDGARIMSKKARLADALNEAALAIATAGSANPNDAERVKLETMLKNYVKSYLPNEVISTANIGISYMTEPETGTNLPVFSINAEVDVKTILPLDIFPAFDSNIGLTNQGKVRKGLQDLGRPADYVFVLDFSASMNSGSAQSGMTRLELLKKVVKDITTQAIEAFPETTFTLVPFDTGVMVRYPDMNELDGYVNACSVLMVPKKLNHLTLNMPIGYDIDYDFWHNKILGIKNLTAPTNSATSLPYTLAKVNKELDTQRYNYFNTYVKNSLTRELGRTATWQDLIDRGWCVKNTDKTERADYSCEKDPDKSIFTPENQEKIKNEMERARRLINATTSSTILTTTITDVDATLEGMFDESNIITFPLVYWRTNNYSSTMCYSSATSAGSGTNQLADVVPNAYLIEPTNDLSVLAQFQTMEAKGNTISSSGLLRAVPEMVKGSNPRTVMIIISDGADNNNDMLNALHKNRPAGSRVCDLIREGVKARKPGTEDVDIYFISVVNGAADKERTKYWADYCTGEDNAVIATNYDELMSKLIEFMNQYEETGYFYN